MQDYRKLHVWQRAQDFAARIHRLTMGLAGDGNGAWRSQLRRSSGSIAANIAEGAERGTARQFAHFLEIAIGSASEAENHLDFAVRIDLLSFADAAPLIDEASQIRRMLVTLRQRVLEAPARGNP